MPDHIEKRIGELFRDAIAEFPSDLRQYAEEWIAKRQKALDDIKEFSELLQFI
jgi:hypothetical protein